MARDYALEYERRRIRAQGRGFTSPRQESAYRKEAAEYKAQGKRLTVPNFKRKAEAQVKRAKITRRKQRVKAKETTKYAALKAFGISENTFNRLRKENRAFSRKTNNPRLKYNLKLDERTSEWNTDRVGYIVNYNKVFVNPKTKKAKGKTREKLVEQYGKLINDYDLFADFQELIIGRYAGEVTGINANRKE
jgi:hypothetical protein